MLRSHLFDQPSDPSHWLVVRLAAACAQLVIAPSEQEYLTLAGACGKGLFEHYVIFDTESKDNRFLSKKRLVQLGLLEQREYNKDLPSIYSESDQGSAKETPRVSLIDR